MIMMRISLIALVLGSAALLPACSSTEHKSQAYARLSNTKEFEEEYDVVWKAVKQALSEYRIEEEDEEDGEIQTDWIYSTSNDKYIEYQVNGFPRKKYLQNRYKLAIQVEKQIGSVKVTVNPQEEVEILKSNGASDGWKSVSEPDTARANEVIKNIELKILSRHN